MTVSDLIRTLKGFDPNANVSVAIQPGYPLSTYVDGVKTLRECIDREDLEDHKKSELDTVWIVTGEAGDYTSKSLWE